MVESDHVPKSPTTAVSLLKLEEPEAQDLSEVEVTQILKVLTQGKFSYRDLVLISVLHGLWAEEAASLNLEDAEKAFFEAIGEDNLK